jgi:hypothetical protein
VQLSGHHLPPALEQAKLHCKVYPTVLAPSLNKLVRQLPQEWHLSCSAHWKSVPRVNIVLRHPEKGNPFFSSTEMGSLARDDRPTITIFVMPLLDIRFAEGVTLVVTAQAIVPDRFLVPGA